jgi:hypothetical protein
VPGPGATGARQGARRMLRSQGRASPWQRSIVAPGHVVRSGRRAFYRPRDRGRARTSSGSRNPRAIASPGERLLGGDQDGRLDGPTSQAVPAIDPLRDSSGSPHLVQAAGAGLARRRAGPGRPASVAATGLPGSRNARLLGRDPALEGGSVGRPQACGGRSSSTPGMGTLQASGLARRSDQKDQGREFFQRRELQPNARGSDRRRWGWARGSQGRSACGRPSDRARLDA